VTNKITCWLVCFLLAVVFLMTLMKPPSEVNQMLFMISGQFKNYALLMHAVVLAALLMGLFISKARTHLFAGMVALLAGSAAVIAMVHSVLPNIAVFWLYLVLILMAFFRDQLSWDFSQIKAADWLFGITGIVFGFWYLHWVESPLLLNALLYSPLGILNCPTLVTISGLLCLSSQRPQVLDFTTGLVCTYFGLYGIILLSAYVDVVLVLCGSYQLSRVVLALRQNRPMLA
jgi:hypothetical protein